MIKDRQKLLSNWPVILLLVLIIYFAVDLSGKDFERGSKLLPVFLLSLSSPLFIYGLRKEKREIFKIEDLFLIIFLILNLWSFVFSQVKTFGLSNLLVLLSVSVIYLLFSKTELNFKEILIRVLVYLGLLNVLAGFYFYLTRPEQRMVGLFLRIDVVADMWPNALALFLILIWPLAIYYYYQRPNFKRIILLAILFSGFFLTYSRAGFLTFLGENILLGGYFIRGINCKQFIRKLILFILISIIIINSANYIRGKRFPVHSIKDKIMFEGTERITSINERKELMVGGIKMALDKPLLGYGPSSFPYIYPQYQTTFLARSGHPHNILIKIAAENGIPAMICLIVFLLIIGIKTLIRFKYLTPEQKNLMGIFGIALIGGIVHNLVDYNFNFLINILVFWLLLASLSSFNNQYKRKGKGVFKLSIIIALLIVPLSVYEGYFSYKIARAGRTLYAQGKVEKAMSYFKLYEKALMPRDFFNRMGWDLMGKGLNKQAMTLLAIDAKKNPYQADSLKLMGEILTNERKLEEALIYFEKALVADPMNHFVNYYRVFETLKNLGKTDEIKKQQDKILELLSEFPAMMAVNFHLAGWQIDNQIYAVKLYELLGEINPGQKSHFQEQINLINKIAEEQLKSFKAIKNYWREKGKKIGN